VVRGGMVIARTPPRQTALSLPGRPGMVDAAAYAPPLT
jgi:cytosine deaminase